MTKSVFDPSSKFLDPERILFAAGLGAGHAFADLGAGSGYYSLAGAKIVGEQGVVYSVDVLETALDHIAAESRLKNVRNIKTLACDLEQANACKQIPTGGVDVVLLSNITHQITNRQNLYAECYRMLKTGGKLVVLEWNDHHGPLGPLQTHRVSESDISALAKAASLKPAGKLEVDSYHYGLMFIK